MRFGIYLLIDLCLLGILTRGSLGCLLCLSNLRRPKALSVPSAALPSYHHLPTALTSRRMVQRYATERRAQENDEDSEATFDPLRYRVDEDSGHEDPNEEEAVDEEEEGLKKVMMDSIRWYKSTLSPMMPPNCRFLPTCSSYGLESIKKYGAVKGGILTAWRIIRCTPFGGCGYDAPQWPPVGYRAGSNTKNWF